ncbi:MAG: pectinesterase family protein [Limisphaerales bacterium]
MHSKDGGHVTAASTPSDQPYGFVFIHCRLTGDSIPWLTGPDSPGKTDARAMADLGRPWRPYASVTYLNCWMGPHIKPEGWNNWRNPSNELTARYSEYDSSGPGANPSDRVKWSKQLTTKEAAQITVRSVLGGTDGWTPTAAMSPAP